MARLTRAQNTVWRRWLLGFLNRLRKRTRGGDAEIQSLVLLVTSGRLRWTGPLPCRDWSKDPKYTDPGR